MADFRVENDTTLGSFLRQRKYQQWRIPLLARYGGVKVLRGGSDVPVKDDKTRLRSGDFVRLVDPLPKACQQALLDEAKKKSRDYAFIPGKTAADVGLGKLFEARPETIRIDDPLIGNLTGFIQALKTSILITNPIRNLFVASHANPEGLLFIKLDIIAAKIITYEDLEDAVKTGSIKIDDALLLPRPTDSTGAVIPAQFLFRGCRIGSQPAYMKKLKEALGNKLPVCAPKHFHITGQFTNPPGYLEFMGYNFMVTRPNQLTSKKAVIDAFIAANLLRIDGQPVPKKLWSEWIPDKPNLPGDKKYPNKVRMPVTKQMDNAPRTFRYRKRTLLNQQGSMALPNDTGKTKDRKDAVKQELIKLARYQDTHPFPEFIRYGYQTMDAFMDGWEWHFKYDKSTQTLFFNPTRHEYTLIQPITDIKSSELILNFYPTTTKGKVIELLNVGDNRFFACF